MADYWAKRMLDSLSPEEQRIAAGGGFCLPFENVYDAAALQPREYAVVTFPEVSVSRGGIQYHQPTEAEQRAAEAMHAHLSRLATTLRQRQDAAVDAACREALANGWDVHLYTRPTSWHGGRLRSDTDLSDLAHIGVEFKPARYALPTIVEHRDHDVSWTDDDEWGP